VIDDLDRTIEELLEREFSPALVEQPSISFLAPDNDFVSKVTLPAIDLFLYDVRENLELRNTEWIVDHREDGTATRRRAPIRVDCSYLITAWSGADAKSSAIDEHFLLSEVMKVLLRHPTIPEVLLQGSLKGQAPPLPSSTLQPGRLQSLGEFWQALGGKPKAALNYTVTIGVVADRPIDTEVPVVDKTLRLKPGLQRAP
jgi:hypothetical protein